MVTAIWIRTTSSGCLRLHPIERGGRRSLEFLANPYPFHEQLREAGPVVWLDRYGIWAMARHEEVRACLMDWETFCSSAGVGLSDFHQAMANAQPIVSWITAKCQRAALAPGGLGAQIYAAADTGELTEDEASLLVRSFLTAGLDTTVVGLGNALFCFAQHPDQWQRLRRDPSLARAAFDEVLRYESPVQTFFRTTTRPVEVAGVKLGAGEKVLLFLAAANRDTRRWENPERFDITRRATGHLAFGAGIHGCVGMAVARLEAEIVLSLLARKVEAMELGGEPERRLNNTLRGLARLPIRVRPA